MVSLDDLRTFAKYHLIRRVHDYPAPETELGVELLPFDDDAYAAALRRERAVPFEVRQLAAVGYRGREHPIHVVTSGGASSVSEPAPTGLASSPLANVRKVRGAGKHLLVLAGVHGNEHAGILAVPALLDALGADELARVALTIVTPVNPVGAAHGSRYNADGFDVNRDFFRFETAEARLVRDVFAAARPDMIVSLHEGPQDATFLFANRFVSRERALRMLDAMQAAGTELAREDYFHRVLEPPGYAPMSRAMWALSQLWARVLGMRATAMWADSHGLPEITIESSWRGRQAAARIGPHVALVRAALADLA